MYPNAIVPAGETLWAEQANWASHALNCTTASANPGNKSPHEMWHGSPPDSSPFPFLKPGFCREKRTNKLQPNAQRCWYLSPAPGYPRDAMPVLTTSGSIIATQHVKWARISPTPSPTQQAIRAPGAAEDSKVDDRSEESEPVEETPVVDAPPGGSKKAPTSPSNVEGGGGGATPQNPRRWRGGRNDSTVPLRGRRRWGNTTDPRSRPHRQRGG